MADPSSYSDGCISPARYVAVDTTEFYDCPYLDSPRWNQLRAYLQRTNTTLIVPEVVVAETKRHFRNSLISAVQKSARANDALNRILRSNASKVLEVDIEKACLDYETELSRLLKITGAISPPYAAVSTSAILERCLAGRRPFSSDGKKGFRDAVIWESLVEIIKTPSQTIFITSNTSDFGAHRKLHESLCEDIAGSGKSLIVCDGIEKFAEEFAKPALKILDGIKPRVEDGGFLSDLLHQVVQELNATDQVRGTLRGDIGSASIENMPVLDNEVGDVYDLGNGLLSCSVSYSGHVDVLIVESEYEGPYEPPSHHAGVLSARLETTVEITFRTVGDDEMKLMSFQVDDVQLDFND